jgi:RNA polymerase sigma factor (sigma-70 family)
MPLTAEQAALAGEHVGLAVYLARRLYRSCAAVRRLGFDQAVSAAQLGLLKAAGRYDPARGLPFYALASVCIRHAILNAAHQWCRGPQPLSLDQPDEDGRTIGESIVADQAGGLEDAADLTAALGRLTAKQREVICARLAGSAIKALAGQLGVTGAAVRSREAWAYRTLRRVLGVTAACRMAVRVCKRVPGHLVASDAVPCSGKGTL